MHYTYTHTHTHTHAGVLTEQNGIAAVAGVNANKTHYFPIQSSGTQNIINIAGTSNVNVNGVWIFRLDADNSGSYAKNFQLDYSSNLAMIAKVNYHSDLKLDY